MSSSLCFGWEYGNPTFNRKVSEMSQRWQFLTASFVIVFALTSPSPSSATACDLTTAGSSCTINGAIYQQTDPQPTGSGVIDSFVRTDTPGGQVTPLEQGYNTSVRPMPQSGDGEVNQYTNTTLTFNHDLSLSSVPTSTIGGTLYRAFLLDINESHSDFTDARSEEHTSELQSLAYLVCRLLLEKKK